VPNSYRVPTWDACDSLAEYLGWDECDG
jgi:hypothetical protein